MIFFRAGFVYAKGVSISRDMPISLGEVMQSVPERLTQLLHDASADVQLPHNLWQAQFIPEELAALHMASVGEAGRRDQHLEQNRL